MRCLQFASPLFSIRLCCMPVDRKGISERSHRHKSSGHAFLTIHDQKDGICFGGSRLCWTRAQELTSNFATSSRIRRRIPVTASCPPCFILIKKENAEYRTQNAEKFLHQTR
ncbi:hypothetical protein Mp_7g04210 [Marchantia polymorpha subsp. ruderalis]|uniref:Uncharacterized protein n=2 Tax=Marchantia polymorpha TaxID=3197 RepID=A0AAF6BW05_MARPO|nr:hypothetical protein MARPO_0062s0103 [Marchantia polymorpha]BBN16189.1 hypothetical protein Mp_7g04210 [Marchantia polymorpha subsp. ruderalis]|eukprot:PTQ36692.1 hypothetical protein MARPO_0062s0103 [Marchantia polymorpha]